LIFDKIQGKVISDYVNFDICNVIGFAALDLYL